MITKNTEIKCKCCGKVFYTEYYHGGSNEHDGYTSDHNMQVHVNRLKTGAFNTTLDSFFKDSITLDGNFCNIKDHRYEVGMEILKCRILWLKKNGYNDIADYLEIRKGQEVKDEFNKINDLKIKELQDQIDRLKEKYIK